MSDDLSDFGPAMRALSERQRLFVLALRGQKRKNHTAAARAAGYGKDSYGALRVRGHALAHNEAIVAALQEEAQRHLDGSAFMAADVLVQIANDPKQPTKERRAAAVALLDRSGHGAAQNINVNKTLVDRTGTAMLGRIEALAKLLGVDPAVLLGVNAPVEMKLIEGKVAADAVIHSSDKA